MHAILEQALAKLTAPVLESLPKGKLAQFSEILCHDGSSFALKDTLAKKWPGRFTKVTPAAVELHVTMSVLKDNPVAITLAPDKESERPARRRSASDDTSGSCHRHRVRAIATAAGIKDETCRKKIHEEWLTLPPARRNPSTSP